MEQRYIEHECRIGPYSSVLFDRVNFRWYLDMEEYGTPVQYCPYCGVELKVPDGATKMAMPVYRQPIPPPSRYNDDFFLVIGPRGRVYRIEKPVELPDDWRMISRDDPDFYDSEGLLHHVFWNAQIVTGQRGCVVPWEKV